MKNSKEKELCTSMYGTCECRDPMHKDKGEFCAHCLFENMTWEQYLEKRNTFIEPTKIEPAQNLYRINIDLREGNISGMFYATHENTKKLIGKEVKFGEVLGKYSDIDVVIEEEHIELVIGDQRLLEEIKKRGIDLEIGVNPFEFYACQRCGESLVLDTGKCNKCGGEDEE